MRYTHDMQAQQLVRIEIDPAPPTANANSDFLYTTYINEYPNI